MSTDERVQYNRYNSVSPTESAMTFPRWAIGLLVTLTPFAAHGQEVTSPEQVQGLVARYEVGSGQLGRDRQADVGTWYDSSGNGYDLLLEPDGDPAIRRALRLNQQATIEARKGAYIVREPFELQDHTIFVVAGTLAVDRALFSSDVDSTRGAVLYTMGRNHVLRAGAPVPYTTLDRRTAGFHVITLGRQDGLLRAFLDGDDVSSGDTTSAPLRVGRFFHIDYDSKISKDGSGLEIAEMLFYDRFLARAERDAVTEYLAKRFGLYKEPEPQETSNLPVARLRTEKAIDLNVFDGVAAVSWTVQAELQPPFQHDPGGVASRIRCASDGTRVRVQLSLGVSAPNPGSNVRVLLLKNDSDYLEDEAVSGEFGGKGDAATVTIELETSIVLDEGEWIEVVAHGIGAEGEVLLVPDRTSLVAHALAGLP
jgi:hypothetical protein